MMMDTSGTHWRSISKSTLHLMLHNFRSKERGAREQKTQGIVFEWCKTNKSCCNVCKNQAKAVTSSADKKKVNKSFVT
jgi:hypothetical protein